MSKLLFFLFSIFVFFIVIFLLFIYKAKYSGFKKSKRFSPLIPVPKREEYNPDFNTNNWYLHKHRLLKFGRSQYKGLTFFVNSDNRIYYLSEEGCKIYC